MTPRAWLAAPWTARINILLPGVYAWFASVAYPAAMPQADALPRVTAVLALAALVSGPALAHERPRVARALGIWGFVGLSLLTWVQLGDLIAVDLLDPIRGGLAALGWMFFAFGWGALRTRGTVPENDPHVIAAEPLKARAQPNRKALALLAASAIVAFSCLFVAWTVQRPVHSLLGHAIAVACAVWLTSAAASIGISIGGQRQLPSEGERLARASVPLGALTTMVAAGLAWAIFH